MKVQAKKRLAHLFDTTKCFGCGACTVACTQTNAADLMLHEDKGWQAMPSNIRRVELNHLDKPALLLVQCQHCSNAPCVKTCPFGAMYNDEATGLVKLDEKRCIGCSYCVAACPYNVRWKHPVKGLPMKCMGKACEEKVAAGELRPACRSARSMRAPLATSTTRRARSRAACAPAAPCGCSRPRARNRTSSWWCRS